MQPQPRGRTCSLVVIAWSAALLAGPLRPPAASAASGPPGFVVENAFPGASIRYPVQIVFMPDNRKMVVGLQGIIWMMTPEGTQMPTPFLDISSKVEGAEGMGLLGAALDPDFELNRWVYYAYTVDPDSDGVDDNTETYARIERCQVDAGNPDVADLSTRQVLIGPDWSSGIPCPDLYHTIGSLRFAPDKTLLVSSGDGAHFSVADSGGFDPGQFLPGRADPAEDLGSFRAQTLNSLGGKILRIDKETGHGLPSNPFWDGNPVSARSRVWIYGVRNPFRFTIRPGTGATDPSLGQPGTLYIGDTGWNTYEAVHLAKTGGLNMGWPCQEGPAPQPQYQAVGHTAAGNTNVLCSAPPSPENPVGYTPPLMWWHHSDGNLSFPAGWTGNATVGGTFHQGSSYPPPYAGAYFLSDYSTSWIRWVQLDADDYVTDAGDFVTGAEGPVNTEWDPETGDLYYCALQAGEVRRIHYVLSDLPRSWCVRADSASGTGPYPIPGAGTPWVDLANDHDLALVNFDGTAASGWQGDGTTRSAYRLAFDGTDDLVVLPAGAIPELQSPTQVTTALWFRTGPDVSRPQYLLEWLGQYSPPFPGMSLAIENGHLRLSLDPWVDVAAVRSDTWYHVAVVKGPGSVRVFLDGSLVYSGTQPNLEGQVSEMVLGASTYRGPGSYGEFLLGAIAQSCTWPVALTDNEVLAVYQGTQNLFIPAGTRIACVRADSASGTGPPAVPGAASPWWDLIDSHDAALSNFAGTSGSGWQGDGSTASPYRLEFDGFDDRVTLPAGSFRELEAPVGCTVGLWVRTGPDVQRSQYLLQWVNQYSAPFAGMTLAIANGNFRVDLNPWVDVTPVLPDTWYYFTVAKESGTVRVYVNGLRQYAGTAPNLGGQSSELVLGASTYGGPGVYDDFLSGAIAQLCVWNRAIIDPEVQEAWAADEELYGPPFVWGKVFCVRADSAGGTGHYPIPGKATPWVDLVGTHDARLAGFNGNSSSGWQGDGSGQFPYRLLFDSNNDVVTVPAGSIPELQSPGAATVAMWFRTGSDITSTQYLFEWLARYVAPMDGMSISISGGHLRVNLNPWADVFPLQPNTWYHVAVAKGENSVKVQVNGWSVYSNVYANLGGQLSEVVIGASTYRGLKHYGEYFGGSIAHVCVWPIALSPAGMRAVFRADSALFAGVAVTDVPASNPAVRFRAVPNPFAATLGLEFTLPRSGNIELAVYGVDGRRLRTLAAGPRAAGAHRISWDGRTADGTLARPGIFFIRLDVDGVHTMRRVAFLR